MRSYWLRSGLLALLEKGAALAFSLGATLILLRRLGQADFAAWGLFVLLTYFVEMGRSGLLQNALMTLLAGVRDQPARNGALQTAALALNLAFSLLSNLVLALLLPWLAAAFQAPQLQVLLPVFYLTNLLAVPLTHGNYVQQANFEFRGIFWSTFWMRGSLFAWLLYGLLAARPVHLSELALALLAGSVLAGASTYYYARSFLFLSKKIDFQEIKKILAFGKYVLGTNLSTMLYKNVDKLTLGWMLGPAAFAVYDAAGKITQLVEAPAFSLAAVVFPKSAQRMREQGPEGVRALYERSVGITLALVLPALIPVWIWAEPLVRLLAGPAYSDAADILRITALFGLFLPFAVQFGAILDSTGRPDVNFRYTLLTALLNLALSYGMIGWLGLYGAAWATLCGYAISFVWMQRYLYRHYGIRWWKAFGWWTAAEQPAVMPSLNNAAAPDVVFFTLFRTDNPYSSISLSMAREMARTRRVLYVNHPYSWRDLWRGWRSGDPQVRARLRDQLLGRVRYETLDSIPHNFIAVQPPPVLPVNWLPEGRLYRLLHGWNNRVVLRAIRQAVRAQQFRDYWYINCYNPFYAGVLPPDFGARSCVYHCIDDITQDAYTARHGARLENETIARADLTLVTSSNLYTLKAPLARRIEKYYNAADVDLFSRALTERFDRPAELSGRSGKVIGFTGNLDALRIDYPLLKQVAETFPQHTLLLVGPLNSDEPRAIGLDRLPNVVLAGSRPIEALPPLLQHMDCVLIPFLCNTLTRSIYPLKINEYLAAGKAVVTTSFSDDIRSFSDCIYLAETPATFMACIEQALAENDPALTLKRTRAAQENTWAARVEMFNV